MTAATCAVCKKPSNPEDKFCHYCGAPAGSAAPQKASGETEFLVPLPVTKRTEPKGAPVPEEARRLPWLAIGSVVAIVGMGAGAWWFLRRGTPTAVQPPVPEQPARPPVVPPKPAPPPIATGPARLILTGVPFGATISVDGRRQSGASFELPAGTHVIRVNAAGYAATVDTVTLAPGQRTELQVNARPAGE